MNTTERGTRVVLRDGSEVIIDQVHRTDATLLTEGFARLSDETRRLRFLTAKPRLTEAEVRYFTRVDHHDHEALGAMVPDGTRGVGLARYIRDRNDPETAEVAVTVADHWQGRGLGTELLRRITQRAEEEGIHRFTALVAAENETVIGILHEVGADLEETESGDGVIEYRVTLPTEHANLLQELLRAVARARGRLSPSAPDAVADLVPGGSTEGTGKLPRPS